MGVSQSTMQTVGNIRIFVLSPHSNRPIQCLSSLLNHSSNKPITPTRSLSIMVIETILIISIYLINPFV